MILKISFIVMVFLFGTIIPFVDYWVAIEIFYLLIPLGLLALGSVAYLVRQLISRRQRRDRHALFLALITPTLIVSQFTATTIVDNVQRYRAERLISGITAGGNVPVDLESTLGIEVVRAKNSDAFSVSYSRGFMAREVYNSDTQSWTSVGWND